MSAHIPLVANPLGIIFDWDGVVVDSSAQHEESWERLASQENLGLPPGHFIQGFGRKNEWIIPSLLHWTNDPQEISRLSLKKESLYRDILKEKGIIPLPGVRDFLHRLFLANIPCIVGSSTHRKNIETAIEVLQFSEFFKDIVSAEDVGMGKPHPEVFLKAAKKLNLAPEQCVVIEDAKVGVEAAKAGNIKVIAVTNTHNREALKQAHKIVDNLNEITLDGLHQLIRQ